MNILKFPLWILAIFSMVVNAQPRESMCKTALKFQQYAILGDCYRYGVFYDKDLEKAKTYYLYGAMYRSEQGEHSKLQAADILLADGNSTPNKVMGLYLLKDFSDREDVKRVVEPKYAGDFTRRGSARYILAIYFYQQDDIEGAKEYLEKALEDNYGEAAFALAYLAEAKKLPGSITSELVKSYIKTGEEKQSKFFYWDVTSYSCWLKQQLEKKVEGTLFPVEKSLAEKLLKRRIPCSSDK